jgi:hypothetical protein
LVPVAGHRWLAGYQQSEQLEQLAAAPDLVRLAGCKEFAQLAAVAERIVQLALGRLMRHRWQSASVPDKAAGQAAAWRQLDSALNMDQAIADS